MYSRFRYPLIVYVVTIAAVILKCYAETDIPIQVFSGIQLNPKHLLPYQSSHPWFYEIPINQDIYSNAKFDIKSSCLTNETSESCLLQSNLNNIQDSIFQQINLEMEFLTDYENTTTSPNRTARSLLFIGKFLTFCCSVVNEEEFGSAIENQEDINSNLNKVLQYARQNNVNTFKLQEHFQNFSQNVKNVTLNINKNIITLQQQINHIKKESNLINVQLVSIQNLWHMLFTNYFLDNLRRIKTSCNDNNIPHSLIPETLLKADLLILQKQLNTEDFKLAVDPLKDIKLYYKLKICKCFWSKNKITIKLQLPIIATSSHYTVYQNLPVPLYWDGKICKLTQELFTVISTDNELFISPENDMHCSAKTYPLCKINRIRNLQDPQYNCVKAIFKKLDTSTIKRNCQFNCYEAPQFPHITEIQPNQYLLSNAGNNIKVNCRNESSRNITLKTQNGILLIKLPCHCNLMDKADTILISSSYPCDAHDAGPPQMIHKIPHSWTRLSHLRMTQLHETTPHELINDTDLINPRWLLDIPTFQLNNSIKITEDHFKLKYKPTELKNYDSIFIIILIIWTIALTIITILILLFTIVLNTKVNLILKNDRPPVLPPRTSN